MDETNRQRIHAELDALLERQGQPRTVPRTPKPRPARWATRTRWVPNTAALRYTLRRLAELPGLPGRALALVRDAQRFAGDPEAAR